MTCATRVRSVAVALVVLIAGSACGVRGLNFAQDERVEITAPPDRAEVTLPVTVTWTVRDFDVTGTDGRRARDAGLFGVYVDRAPQPPGETQEWLVRNDPSCKRDPACPDTAFLEQRDIFATSQTSFVVDRVRAPTGDAVRRREFHEVTVVLLNGRGERIGESAFVRQFEVDRDG